MMNENHVSELIYEERRDIREIEHDCDSQLVVRAFVVSHCRGDEAPVNLLLVETFALAFTRERVDEEGSHISVRRRGAFASVLEVPALAAARVAVDAANIWFQEGRQGVRAKLDEECATLRAQRDITRAT